MTTLVSMAGTPGPLERTGRAKTMSDVKDTEVVRRPRGRPRKNPDVSRRSEEARQPDQPRTQHYAEIRYKRKLAGITHKQFRILAEDEAEAERLLMPLINKATTAYHEVSLSLQPEAMEQDSEEPFDYGTEDVLEPEPVAVSQEPPTASLPEIEAAPAAGACREAKAHQGARKALPEGIQEVKRHDGPDTRGRAQDPGQWPLSRRRDVPCAPPSSRRYPSCQSIFRAFPGMALLHLQGAP